MTKLLKMIALFFCFSLALSICIITWFAFTNKLTINDIPAPNLSDSYSYNEKMRFLQHHKMKIQILTLGSSMSLYNVHSKTITEKLKSDSYLNASSWGMTMKDDFYLLKILSHVYSPRILIIASNRSDFTRRDKDVKYSVLPHYLHSKERYSFLYYAQCFNLKYYTTNSIVTKKVRSCKTDYDYLVFDTYGGVNFDSSHFNIIAAKWNEDFLSKIILSYQYAYLDSISLFCKNNNIKLLFMESPYRKGLYDNFDKIKLKALTSHATMIEKILKRGHHIFVDANKVFWEDCFFVDGTHLNTEGARYFTEYCCNKIKSMN